MIKEFPDLDELDEIGLTASQRAFIVLFQCKWNENSGRPQADEFTVSELAAIAKVSTSTIVATRRIFRRASLPRNGSDENRRKRFLKEIASLRKENASLRKENDLLMASIERLLRNRSEQKQPGCTEPLCQRRPSP